MAEIYKNSRGFALIAATLVLTLMLLLTAYLISFTLTEAKISNSQEISVKAYYLAESGIAEAIWRIKNDATWKTNFETNSSWSITSTQDPAIYSNGSYQIQINNSALAKGEIISTGFLDLGDGTTAQRVIKTTVYKAIGDSPVDDNAGYSDGNVDMSGAKIDIDGGGMFSNGNIIVNFYSVVDVDNNVTAVGNINKSFSSTINATAIIEGADPILMPAVSFDDTDDPDSYINQADIVYSENDFEDLIYDNRGGNLTLPGPITYVEGDIDIMGDINLTITGVLVAEDDMTVGTNKWSCCSGGACGGSDVTINKVSSTTPSGLLAKGKIDFELCLDSFNAEGLIYANDQINVLGIPASFTLTGGSISRKLTMTSVWQPLQIIRDNTRIITALGDPSYSPVVTVEHWEEEY